MPHTPRSKCAGCERSLDSHEFREVMSVGIENLAISHSNANIDTQPKSISIPVFRCSKSHHSCVFCDEKDSCSTKVLSCIQRTMIFLKCEQFNLLVNTVSSMRNSHVRSVRVVVAVFLAKLRLGLSNRPRSINLYRTRPFGMRRIAVVLHRAKKRSCTVVIRCMAKRQITAIFGQKRYKTIVYVAVCDCLQS
ncbi:unnamed protein product [Rotaria socialis]|uniref:Uncharacterized protein n=1 Tax=Rotaria socialis TaxID=392032 RepID=A0A820YPW7_9BILA|nr:unnamed protein product [Rotaria socialis]